MYKITIGLSEGEAVDLRAGDFGCLLHLFVQDFSACAVFRQRRVCWFDEEMIFWKVFTELQNRISGLYPVMKRYTIYAGITGQRMYARKS